MKSQTKVIIIDKLYKLIENLDEYNLKDKLYKLIQKLDEDSLKEELNDLLYKLDSEELLKRKKHNKSIIISSTYYLKNNNGLNSENYLNTTFIQDRCLANIEASEIENNLIDNNIKT